MKLQLERHNLVFGLIYSVHFLVLFNAVLVKIGISYVYIALMLALIFIVLAFGIKKNKTKRYSAHFAYIVLLTALASIHIVFLNTDYSAIISLGLYLSPIICWILVFSRYGYHEFERIFKKTYNLSLVVSVLGIIQYFFSPGLFGFIPTNSMAIQWAVDRSFSEYAVFFRATSTLGSPQVFGLYCALQLIIANRFKYLFNPNSYWFGFAVLLVGGALSGNKSFFVIFIGYFLLLNLHKAFNSIKAIFAIILLSITVVSSSLFLLDKVPMLERVFSLESIAEQEGRDSRMSRYEYILDNTDVLQGNGMGAITNKRHNELRAAESYIFKVYYEAGIFGLLGLLGILTSSVIASSLRSYSDFLIVLFILVSMMVVHAFESPVFFVVWGYLTSLLANSASEGKGGRTTK